MSPQAQDPRWVAFSDRAPPEDRAINGLDPRAMIPRTVLVTNNLHATSATGCMSNIWFAMPIKTAVDDEWVAFDEGDRKIRHLTHWLDPFDAAQPLLSTLRKRADAADTLQAQVDALATATKALKSALHFRFALIASGADSKRIEHADTKMWEAADAASSALAAAGR